MVMCVVGQDAYIPKVNLPEVLRGHFQHGVVGITGSPRKMQGELTLEVPEEIEHPQSPFREIQHDLLHDEP